MSIMVTGVTFEEPGGYISHVARESQGLTKRSAGYPILVGARDVFPGDPK